MDNPTDWRHLLRAARKALKLDQAEVARAVGVSPETLRSYELGRRVPRREHLEALLLALKIPNDTANAIRDALGYASVLFQFERNRDFFFKLEELPAVVEDTPWPQFVVNDAFEICAANSWMAAVWDIDYEFEYNSRTRVQRNLLSVTGDARFADRLKNWDEIVAMFASIFKSPYPTSFELEAPTPYFNEVIAEFVKGDPVLIKRLLDIWAVTEPRTSKVRSSYPIIWEDTDFGEMRFRGVITNASYPDALSFNDWIPLDAETWQVLTRVKARHSERMSK